MKTSIIIADDHPVYRQGLKMIIDAHAGFKVIHEAANGREALRLARESRPEVIVLDVDMPELSGLDVARAIRKERLPVKVIFLTMYREEDMFQEAMETGARGYVLKESAVTDILGSIKTVLEGKRYISPVLSDFLFARSERAGELVKAKPGLDDLTPAERRILKLVAENKTSKEIADELELSVRTIEHHRANICTKLDLHGIHSLVKFAFDNRTRL